MSNFLKSTHLYASVLDHTYGLHSCFIAHTVLLKKKVRLLLGCAPVHEMDLNRCIPFHNNTFQNHKCESCTHVYLCLILFGIAGLSKCNKFKILASMPPKLNFSIPVELVVEILQDETYDGANNMHTL